MKKVCFVTLSRSEYTSLRPLVRAALRDPGLEVRVIAGGSHLLKRFGSGLDEIKKDNIPVHHELAFLHDTDNSDLDTARALGRALPRFVDCLHSEKPDFVFLIGDRWEMLAPSTAASLLRIPIAHHSGGDITQGSYDNQTRYTLSTQSHLHFVAMEIHRRRLIRMGEESWRVVHTGEPSLVEATGKAASVTDIRGQLGIENAKPFVLATFHPTTFDEIGFGEQLATFLKTLDLIATDIVLTAPCPDPGNQAFYDGLVSYANGHRNVHFFPGLGPDRYYAAMGSAAFMIGNSSSGIWEAPSFELPVVNIGHRQQGRIRAANTVDVSFDVAAIATAIERVTVPSFRQRLAGLQNPYGHQNTLGLILRALKESPPREKLLEKKFIDPLEANLT
ncbi:MAG: UDP-N-acetylglucosamine 2-epimerase (hydrolyzing) [Deltaproteobacteria bacterium]|nr:UDP-N-acetylglucosamine 2-epimerase (hydrolyzing) [Deltaproteobacteria bacterium]MBI3295905.1 UDP-N-acetylglucosamine 2-epimerase (hydrolyzing) [Deltaproteobacteria bacterium]